MFICAVKMDGWRVFFQSSKDLGPAFLYLATTPAFLGLEVLGNETSGKYIVRYRESNQISVKYSSKTVTICAPWSMVCEGETLLYAALPFMELQRQQHGFITAHAAAVSFSGKAVLILGKEGSGKTITALSLCRVYGAQLIGNDLVVLGTANGIGEAIVHSGTRFLSLRYESIMRNMPDLVNLFPHQEEDSWLRKVLLSPSRANINVCVNEVPVKSAFLVHVDETKSHLFVKSADTVITRLYLNENFSRYIRGTCITLLGKELQYLGYVPSFDTEVLFKKRVTLMNKLLDDCSMKYVSGPLKMVVDYIAT